MSTRRGEDRLARVELVRPHPAEHRHALEVQRAGMPVGTRGDRRPAEAVDDRVQQPDPLRVLGARDRPADAERDLDPQAGVDARAERKCRLDDEAGRRSTARDRPRPARGRGRACVWRRRSRPSVADDSDEALDEEPAQRQAAAELRIGGGVASASTSKPAARVRRCGRSPFAASIVEPPAARERDRLRERVGAAVEDPRRSRSGARRSPSARARRSRSGTRGAAPPVRTR